MLVAKMATKLRSLKKPFPRAHTGKELTANSVNKTNWPSLDLNLGEDEWDKTTSLSEVRPLGPLWSSKFSTEFCQESLTYPVEVTKRKKM